jgi:hypothetical protein
VWVSDRRGALQVILADGRRSEFSASIFKKVSSNTVFSCRSRDALPLFNAQDLREAQEIQRKRNNPQKKTHTESNSNTQGCAEPRRKCTFPPALKLAAEKLKHNEKMRGNSAQMQ